MEAFLIVAGIAGLLFYMKGKAAESAAPDNGSVGDAANTQAPTGNLPPIHPVDPPIGAKRSYPPVFNKLMPSTGPDVNMSRIVGPRKSFPLQCGGGGPENLGAIPVNKQVRLLPLTQPSWMFESDSEYIGYARPSDKPLLAGGDNFGNQPQDAFRFLGDNFGGRG